jgi:C1A family cysteine protease
MPIYNHKKDTLKGNEHKFTSEHHIISSQLLPPKFDLRTTGFIPDILDQGQIGTCAGNELSNALKFCLKKEKASLFQPSRLFIYYFARLLDGSPTTEDTGISIKSGCDSIRKYGVCSENNWGYDIAKYTDQPVDPAIKAAKTHTNFSYLLVSQNETSIKQALFSGFPIVFGIKVYESFESEQVAKTGIVPMPDTSKEKNLGSHCCQLIGWEDTTQTFLCANSWGTEWGQEGFFTLPYKFVLDPNLASDFWQLRLFR